MAAWEALFDELVDLDESAQLERLAALAVEDAELARFVGNLLVADRRGCVEPLLERSPAFVASALLEPAAERLRERIGPYRIVGKLGQGGMGEVFLAERADGEFEHRVALKLIRAEVGSQKVHARFLRERQILAGLDHPGIARLLDGGRTASGDPYFVLEYVDGEPITDGCCRQGTGLDARVRLLREVALAVESAHGRNIVHRDLKPSNILVNAEGRPKLLDFGIAKILAEEPGSALETQLEGRILTPAYAAPEQILGETVTPATDVFALGALLYELLCGAVPFPGRRGSIPQLAKEVDFETVIKPSQVAREAEGAPLLRSFAFDLEGDLDCIVAKALYREPSRRYASAAELADDLERFLASDAVLARPDSFPYRAGKFLRRRGTAWLALAAILLALFSFLAVFALRTRQSPDPLAAAAAANEKRLAVVAFRDAGGRSETAWVAGALSQLLSDELAQSAGLELAAGEEVARMSGELALAPAETYAAASLEKMGRSLNVAYIVDGSVLVLPGDPARLRVAAHLQQVAGGRTLATVTHDGPLSDLLELAAATGDELRQVLGYPLAPLAERRRGASRLPSQPEARRAYVEGIEALRRLDLRQAKREFARTTELEPGLAAGWQALSKVLAGLGEEPRALQAAERAFALVAPLPEKDQWRIEASYRRLAHDLPAAIDVLRRLVAADPGNIEDALELARTLESAGRSQEAAALVEELRRQNPATARDARVYLQAAIAAELLGKNEQALEATAKGFEIAQIQGSPRLMAEQLVRRASVLAAIHPARFVEGLQALKEAEELVAQAPDINLEIRLEWGRGNLEDAAAREGDPQRYTLAEAAWRRGLAKAKEAGTGLHELGLLSNLGHAAMVRGDLRVAERDLRAGIERAKELESVFKEADFASELAQALRLRGKLAESRLWALDAARVYGAAKDDFGAAVALCEVAELDLVAGETAAAVAQLEKLLAQFEILDPDSSAAWVAIDLAYAELELEPAPGDLSARLRAAIAGHKAPSDPFFAAYARGALSASLLRESSCPAAAVEGRLAAEKAPPPARPSLTFRIAKAHAEALLECGDAEARAGEAWLAAAKASGAGLAELDARWLLLRLASRGGEGNKAARAELAAEARKMGYLSLARRISSWKLPPQGTT